MSPLLEMVCQKALGHGNYILKQLRGILNVVQFTEYLRASLSVQCPPIFSAYLRSKLLPSQQEIVAAAERSAALGIN